MKTRFSKIYKVVGSVFLSVSLWGSIEAIGEVLGDGSAETPYIITEAADLQKINEYPEARFKLGNNIDLTDWISENEAEKGWVPLCTEIPFTGELDGAGYAITGLWSNRPSEGNIGLFCQMGSNATVKNLVIKLSKKGIIGSSRVGALAGTFVNGSATIAIENCAVIGDIKGREGCGAFCGYLPAVLPFYMNNCYAEGSVTLSNTDDSDTAPQYGGGLIGYIWGKSEININSCYAINSVVAEDGGANVGGLVGLAGGSKKNNTWLNISNCAAINPDIKSSVSGTVGRIYGAKSSPVVVNLTNNIALASMEISDSDGAVEIISDASGQHGADKSLEELKSQDTYQALGWSFDTEHWGMGNKEYFFPVLSSLNLDVQPIVMPVAFGGADISYDLPTKKAIVEKMTMVNDYYMAANPSPGDNKWVKSAYFVGCMEFYNVYPVKAFLDYMNLWGENNKWALGSAAEGHGADQQVCGQTYIDLYNLDTEKDENKIKAIKESMDYLVANQVEADDDWFWVDALFMAMPVFSKLGVLYDEDAYFDRMYSMYQNTKNVRGLYETTDHLWFRDESQMPAKRLSPNGKNVYWSRGNGWALAAYARVLRDLPKESPYRDEFVQIFKEMAEALKERQREDGFWNVSLDDPEHYGGPETSGTSLFVYGMAWGINNGILDARTYLPVVAKAWEGLITTAVQSTGFLGYVQGAGYKPESSQPVTASTTADFGVGAFLLAGSEMVKLAPGEMPVPDEEIVNMVVTASGYEEGTTNTPDKTLDRNFGTRWSAEGEQWIKYDLLAEKTVTSVDIAFYVGNTRKTNFSIQVSKDDTEWITVFEGQSGGVTNFWENFAFGPRRARYVKILGTGNNRNKWNSISEVRINAEEGAADVQDYIDIITDRLVSSLLSDGFEDPSQLMSSMKDDGSWPDIDYTDKNSLDGWAQIQHFYNLKDMAVAYRHPESPYYKNSDLLGKIIKGCDYVMNTDWEDLENWWWNDFGEPQSFMLTLILIKGDILSTDLKNYSAFIPNRYGNASDKGQNKAWASEMIIYKGCLEDDFQTVYSGFSSMATILEFAPTQFPIAAGQKVEGIKYDYSFHQHRRQLQSGSYGLTVVPFLTKTMQLAIETPFAATFTDKQRDMFSKLLREGHMLLSYRTIMDFGCKGRDLSGNTGFDPLELDKMVEIDPDYSGVYSQWKEHIENGAAFPSPGNKYFWDSNIMTHHGTDYYLSAKIVSSRCVGTEEINNENVRGYNYPMGATNIMTTGKEYYEIAPVWDWCRVPGTTAAQDDAYSRLSGYLYGTNEFGGGVTDNETGVIAYEHDYKDLKVKKAYFFMDDVMVCLGAGISATHSIPIVTSVNQCLKSGDISYFDGKNVLSVLSPQTGDDIKWVHHDNVGYIFMSPVNVTVQGEDQTGSWSKVYSSSGSTEQITKSVFSVWINHGIKPDNGSYQYLVVPRKTVEETGEYAENIPLKIIRNDEDAQAVYDSNHNRYGVVCYAPGVITLNEGLKVSCEKPCIFLLAIKGTDYIVSMADPLYNSTSIVLTISKSLSGDGAVVSSEKGATDLKIMLPSGQYTGSSVTKTFIETSITGDEEIIENDGLGLFPNPVTDILYIRGLREGDIVFVFDSVGRKILETGDSIINIASFPEGVYFVKIQDFVSKVIKK